MFGTWGGLTANLRTELRLIQITIMNAIAISEPINDIRFPKTIEQLDSRVFKRYFQYKEEFNAKQVLGTKVHLKGSHLNIFQSIMYKYLPSFRALVNSPLWADSDKVPALHTTRRELANLGHCCPRTIYNILARLSAAGIISVEEQTESRKAGYVITPSLYFVLGLEEFKPSVQVLNEEPTVLLNTNTRQKLPHINNQEILNNKNKAEDVSIDPKEDTKELYQRKKQTEPSGGIMQVSGVENLQNTKEILQTGAVGDVDKSILEIANERASSKREHFFGKSSGAGVKKAEKVVEGIKPHEKARLVEDFWKYAKGKLFASWTFEAETERKILNVIREDVFGGFLGNEDFNYWQVFALMRQAETDLMAGNNEKYDRKAFFPEYYFSKNYAKRGGFLSAHAWTKKERKKFTELQHKELLQQAKESVLCGKVPVHQKDKINNPKDLAMYWQTKLARQTGSSEIVNQFLEFISKTNITRPWMKQSS